MTKDLEHSHQVSIMGGIIITHSHDVDESKPPHAHEIISGPAYVSIQKTVGAAQ